MILRFFLPRLYATVTLAASSTMAFGNPLTVKAKVAGAEVEPQVAERRQIQMPALDVAIVASLDCPDATEPESLMVSVSDTHQHYDAEQLVDAASIEAVFNVPSNQLAPFTASEFCIAGVPPDEQSLELPGIATAQASLRCRGQDNATSVHFASTSVSVRIYCAAEGDPDSSSADR